MKKLLLLSFCALIVLSCKNDSNSENTEASSKSYDQEDGLVTMRGDFIYFGDAAVLQTKNDIYGVVVDEVMHDLDKQVKPYKKEDTDMVPVTVRVKRYETNNPDTWKYRVEIKEILKIEAPDPNRSDVIKLEN